MSVSQIQNQCVLGNFFLVDIYVLWVSLWRILLDGLRQGCYKGKCSMGVLVHLYISRLGEAAHPSKWQKYIKVLTQLNLICHWTVGSRELKKPGPGILVTSFLAFFHFGLCLCFTQRNNREKKCFGFLKQMPRITGSWCKYKLYLWAYIWVSAVAEASIAFCSERSLQYFSHWLVFWFAFFFKKHFMEEYQFHEKCARNIYISVSRCTFREVAEQFCNP